MTPLKVSSTLEVSLMSKPTTLKNSWPLLTKESFPLPLKPTRESSNITHLESSPEVDVETNSTMESLLLVTTPMPLLSRTLGDLNGVTTVMFNLFCSNPSYLPLHQYLWYPQ